MSLFPLTMQQLPRQLINACWSLICTNYIFFNPFPPLSPTEAALQKTAWEGVLLLLAQVLFSIPRCLCRLQVMLHYPGTAHGIIPQAAILGRQHGVGGYFTLLFSLP